MIIIIKRSVLKLVTRTCLAISLVSALIGFVLVFTGPESLFDIVFWFWLIPLGIWLILDPEYTIIKDFKNAWHSMKNIGRKEA